MKNSGCVPALLLLLFSTTLAQQTSPLPKSHDISPTEASGKPALAVIAQQRGKGVWDQMMDEKCREWDRNPKEAPASAAWVCVNGRAATQQETNEILEKMRRKSEKNWRQWDQQSRQQQRDILKLSPKGSLSAQPQPGNTILESQATPQSRPNQPAAPALSLPANWSFAHPHADMLMAIHVATLRQSSTLQELLARLPASMQENARYVGSQLMQVGQLDQVWLSVRSGDFLALLQGRLTFPPGFVQLGNGTASYRISSTAVVIGRPASVAEAVQRLSRAGAAPSPTVRQMKELGAENDIWLTGTRALLTAPTTMSLPTPLTNDVTGFSLAFALRDGLKLQMRVNSGTLAGARRLLAAMSKNPALPDSPASVDKQLEGTSVRITLAIDKAKLMETIDKALSTPMGQKLTAMADASARARNKIVIQGLPGGPKEMLPSGQWAPAPADTTAPLGKIVIQGLPGGPKVISPKQ